MRDETWAKGLGDLIASFPDRDQDAAVMKVRGEVYHRELKSLTDEQWLYAVSETIRGESWFPTVKALLAAAHAPGAPRPKALQPHPMTDEEREEAREMSRKGLEMCREAFRRVTGDEPPEVVKPMPGAIQEQPELLPAE